MKVVYPTCCGVDVHKTFLVATIITTEEITPRYCKKRFSTFNSSILEFKQWLLESGCKDLRMEITGKYWISVSNLWEDSINVTIANPKGFLLLRVTRMMLRIPSGLVNCSDWAWYPAASFHSKHFAFCGSICVTGLS